MFYLLKDMFKYTNNDKSVGRRKHLMLQVERREAGPLLEVVVDPVEEGWMCVTLPTRLVEVHYTRLQIKKTLVK